MMSSLVPRCPEGQRTAIVLTTCAAGMRCFNLYGAYRMETNARNTWAQGLQQKQEHAVMSGLLSRCVDCVATFGVDGRVQSASASMNTIFGGPIQGVSDISDSTAGLEIRRLLGVVHRSQSVDTIPTILLQSISGDMTLRCHGERSRSHLHFR